MIVKLIPTTRKHCEYVANNIRAIDKEECIATRGDVPLFNIILEGYLSSAECYTGVCGLEIVGIMGFRRESYKWVIPWLIATENMNKHKTAFVRSTDFYFPVFKTRYPNMKNIIYEKNRASVRWLKHLGFQFSEPFTYGSKPERFMLFSMTNLKK